MIAIESLTLSYQARTIIESISTNIPEEKITVLIGANGCGKSTLLKSLAKLLLPCSGQVLLNDQNITKLSHKALSQQLAMLAQSTNMTEDITVEQLVRYGRHPYHSLFSRWRDEDDHHLENALALTQMKDLRSESLLSLSGGQRQRAWIAMTLAQDTPYLLLDEPTTYLDLTYQIEILSLLRDLNRTTQKTIVMVLHDLNLACRYADHMIAIKDGKIAAMGKPIDVVTEDNVLNIFNLPNKVIMDPFNQTPLCIPLS